MGEILRDDIFSIDGVLLTPLNVINVDGGDVLHGMKWSDPGYSGFGEAYYSTIESGAVKAWKRHQNMTINLIVPLGSVRFVIYDDRQNRGRVGKCKEIILSRENYYRLTIPKMVWVGFQGIDEGTSMLLNVADISHTPEECDRKERDEFTYDWRLTK